MEVDKSVNKEHDIHTNKGDCNCKEDKNLEKDSSTKNSKTIAKEEKYKASKFLLEYMYKEYSRENERRKNIESRIPILITITIFFGSAIIIDNKVSFSDMLQGGDKRLYLFIALQTLSCLTLLASMIIFVSILVSREYRSVDLDNITALEPQKAEEGLIAYELIKSYKGCLDFNRNVNDFKFKINNIGIVLLMLSVILYLVLRIFDIFI